MKHSLSLKHTKVHFNAIATLVALSTSLSACLSENPTPVGYPQAKSPNTSGSSSNSTDLSAYRRAKWTKLVFNKQSFYNNFSTNSSGCSGDARIYYDPETDRQLPAKPDWIKNVAVEITNANAGGGASAASSCSLGSFATSPASSCATFDDAQPLDGTNASILLLGGAKCSSAMTGCSSNTVSNDIWKLRVMPPSSGGASYNTVAWGSESQPLPTISTSGQGLVWAGGDYHENQNAFYLFGGAVPNTAGTTNGFSASVVRVPLDAGYSVSNITAPSTRTPSSQIIYAGWASANFQAAGSHPSSRVGATFTYASRRDPSMKTMCVNGFALDGTQGTCTSTSTLTSPAASIAEDQDYLLLVGGMSATGLLSDQIYAYKPRDINHGTTSAFVPPDGGSWYQLSNFTAGAGISDKAMKIVSISSQTSDTTPYYPTSLTSFTPLAFHRTVYDPMMNRFYIFGGITAATNLIDVSAGGTTPTLSSSYVWMYDPPALGRRPTAACYTKETPAAETIPRDNGAGAAPVLGAQNELGANAAYATQNFVFPPGGCLQRISLSNAPTARFEHSMAFDRDQKAMLVFGGCTEPATVSDSGTAISSGLAGDPTTACSYATTLNDTWIYLPPTRTEYVAQDYRDSSSTNPFNTNYLISNVFGTSFWTNFLPLFSTRTDPYSGAVSKPRSDEVLGTWIQLSPSSYPTRRTSASLAFDRAHHKFYLFGGYGCSDSTCSAGMGPLNDLWEFTPPNVETQCDRVAQTCSAQGNWRLVQSNTLNPTAGTMPTQRRSALMAFTHGTFSSGDEFYTVSDSACINQGPVNSGDAASSKKLVGAIYVDIDRSYFSDSENLLLNLKMIPYDENTRLPSISDSSTPFTQTDDTDIASRNDRAVIRIQLLHNNYSQETQIQRAIQPRFHEYMSGTPVLGNEFTFIAGATGQLTEKQVLIPLKLDSSINLIKIERVEGSAKFFELTLTKF